MASIESNIFSTEISLVTRIIKANCAAKPGQSNPKPQPAKINQDKIDVATGGKKRCSERSKDVSHVSITGP